jgi:hypothetical protein
MIRIRTSLGRSSRSLLAVSALALTCLTLILAHGAPGLDHMASMDQGDHMGKAAISLCLAIVGAGLSMLVLSGGTTLWRGRAPRRIASNAPGVLITHLRHVSAPEARAGPARLQVFLR